MTVRLDVELSPAQVERLAATDPRWWFTTIEFANASSPVHPHDRLAANNEAKQDLVTDWIERVSPGRSVLDTCCANGGFSFLAAQAGATEVVGYDFEDARIEMGTLVVDLLEEAGHPLPVTFEQLDAYETARHYGDRRFDVSFCLGSLYHLADPPYILRQIRQVTADDGWLILQSSGMQPGEGNHASFIVRSDRTDAGLSSIRGGNGVWTYTIECMRQMIAHGGFEIVEERQPPEGERDRYPWYAALARAF